MWTNASSWPSAAAASGCRIDLVGRSPTSRDASKTERLEKASVQVLRE
jgi:hypothetical protein